VGIRAGFCKYNITIEKCTLEKVEKDFLRPFYSFTDEGVIGKDWSAVSTPCMCVL
jgi:hypothetical protein